MNEFKLKLEKIIVYPSGQILEMSNGYPHSASPLGNSPSPGPSPGIGGHNNHKCKHGVTFLINFYLF